MESFTYITCLYTETIRTPLSILWFVLGFITYTFFVDLPFSRFTIYHQHRCTILIPIKKKRKTKKVNSEMCYLDYFLCCLVI